MKTQCTNCKTEFEAKRKTARFCSDLCRVQFNRRKGELVSLPPPGLTGIDLAIWKAEQKQKS